MISDADILKTRKGGVNADLVSVILNAEILGNRILDISIAFNVHGFHHRFSLCTYLCVRHDTRMFMPYAYHDSNKCTCVCVCVFAYVYMYIYKCGSVDFWQPHSDEH